MNPKDQIHYDIAELLEKIAHLNIKLAGATKIHPVELDLLRSYLREMEKLADSMPLMQLPKPSFAIPQQQDTQPSSLPSFNTPEESPVETPVQTTAAEEPPAPTLEEQPKHEEATTKIDAEEPEPETSVEQDTKPEPNTNTWQWGREEDTTEEANTQEVEDEPEPEITQNETNDAKATEEPAAEVLEVVEENAMAADNFAFVEEEIETEFVVEEELEVAEEDIDEPEKDSTETKTMEAPQPEKPRFQWELPDKPVAPEAEPTSPESNETTNEVADSQQEEEQEPEAPTYPIWAEAPAEEPIAETPAPEETHQQETLQEEVPDAAEESPLQEDVFEPTMSTQAPEPAAPAEEPAKPRSLNDLFNKGESQDLGSRFQFQNRKNLREMIDLSERYVFTKELFGGDADYYDRAIRQLNQFETLAEAQQYLKTDLRIKYNWENKEQVEIQFTRIVERRFA